MVVVNGVEYLSPQQQQAVIDELYAAIVDLPPGPVAEPGSVKKHLRCPSCWNTLRGRAARRKWARQISGPLRKDCYSCSECGTEWVVDVRSEDDDNGVQVKEIRISEVRK